jgi:2-keto-3-deoxy-galactonokinase
VLHGVTPLENTAFFSGLLIGAELTAIEMLAGNCPIVLAATSGLATPYACAMQIIAPGSNPCTQIPPGEVERAIISAHALFLEKMVPATPADKPESDRER